MKEIELVYEIEWILNTIYKESDRLLDKITDTLTFEERTFKDVGQYLSESKENCNNKRHIIYLIKRKVWEAENRYKREDYINFSSLDKEGGDDEIDFEPVDILTDVESEVIQKETAALLTQDDRRKEKIIRHWAIGNTNSAHISRSLTRSYGGNEEAHRKYIQRFRQSCREQLSAAI